MSTERTAIDDPQPSSRPLLGWDVSFALVIAAMAVIGVWDADAGEAFGLVALLGVLALLSVAHLWLGRPALRRALRNDQAHAVDFVYLGTLVALIGIATAITPDYATLQAVGYPIIWTVVARYRDAVMWNVALAVVVGTGCVVSFTRLDVSGGAAIGIGVGVLSLVFALFMGTWMTRIFAQGERFRLLAAQLRDAQNEVAALSQEAGATAEREQLSRELHDTLTQTLAGLVMLSEQTVRALDAGDQERARERLSRVEDAARTAGAEARALVAGTHPLGEGNLEPAIERVADSLRRDFGIEVVCNLDQVTVARDLQVVLLRATQEGLSNVRRHAQAERVWVRLEAVSDGTVLTIEDDGVGPGAAGLGMAGLGVAAHPTLPGAGSGFGLRGLHDRVSLVGGSVQLAAREGGGSRLQVRLPCEVSSGSGAEHV